MGTQPVPFSLGGSAIALRATVVVFARIIPAFIAHLRIKELADPTGGPGGSCGIPTRAGLTTACLSVRSIYTHIGGVMFTQAVAAPCNGFGPACKGLVVESEVHHPPFQRLVVGCPSPEACIIGDPSFSYEGLLCLHDRFLIGHQIRNFPREFGRQYRY